MNHSNEDSLNPKSSRQFAVKLETLFLRARHDHLTPSEKREIWSRVGAVVGTRSVGMSFAMVFVVACSSSSTPQGPANDGGRMGDSGASTDAPAPDVSSAPDGSSGAPACGLLGGGGSCGLGMTCCVDLTGLLGGLAGGGGGGGGGGLTGGLGGMCVPSGSCSSGISMECSSSSNCANNQVCCGGTASAASEGGAADASAGAPGGLGGGFPGLGGGGGGGLFGNTTCQATCMPGQQQQCASDGECPAGQTCQMQTFGGFPGAGGFPGGGGQGGGGLGGLIMLPMVCAAPMPEAGTD
jgi:hypothetical protein